MTFMSSERKVGTKALRRAIESDESSQSRKEMMTVLKSNDANVAHLAACTEYDATTSRLEKRFKYSSPDEKDVHLKALRAHLDTPVPSKENAIIHTPVANSQNIGDIPNIFSPTLEN